LIIADTASAAIDAACHYYGAPRRRFERGMLSDDMLLLALMAFSIFYFDAADISLPLSATAFDVVIIACHDTLPLPFYYADYFSLPVFRASARRSAQREARRVAQQPRTALPMLSG
jgi:hypothetical protein